jgi:hypothetical protein
MARVYNLASGTESCARNMPPFRLYALSNMSQSIDLLGDYSLKELQLKTLYVTFSFGKHLLTNKFGAAILLPTLLPTAVLYVWQTVHLPVQEPGILSLHAI